jgi:hypothetical protein
MPDVAGTGAVDARRELEVLLDRCAGERSRFAAAAVTLPALSEALWQQRSLEVEGAFASPDDALGWLAREVWVYLLGCDRAPGGALALGVALGLEPAAIVQALIGPSLLYGSLRLTEDVVYGTRPNEAATDLVAFLARHFDEPEARALAVLAAVALGRRGANLVDGCVAGKSAAAVRAMALVATAERPGRGGARRADEVTSSWSRLLSFPLLRAAGRDDDAALRRFVEEALALDGMVEAARSAIDRAEGDGAGGASPAGEPGLDVPLRRLLDLEALAGQLSPDLVPYAAARVGDLAVDWLRAVDRHRQIGAWLSGAARTEAATGPAAVRAGAAAPGTPLTVMMFGYCFNVEGEQRLIGVYKRLVRVGMELVRRGHVVHLNVSGGRNYSDPLIELARRSPGFSFVDLALRLDRPDDAEWNLAVHRDAIMQVRPDVVLVGDVPLAGAILQASIATTQCGVPMVVAENLYAAKTVADRLLGQGSYADGLLLVGPSSHEMRPVPPVVYYAPPFAPAPEEMDAVAIDELLEHEPEIVVLGYDPSVAQLGLQLARALGPAHQPVVVITADAEGVRSFAESISLPPSAVTTLPPVTENQLFALLRAARLAVVKAGFMQMSECLALGTPVVALRYSDFEVGWLPTRSQRLVVSARDTTPTWAVVNGARRLLGSPHDAGEVHEGPLDGTSAAADCVEQVAAGGLRSTTADAARIGIAPEIVERALRSWWSPAAVELTMLRCNSIRGFESLEVFAAVAHARCDGEVRAPALAIWLFDTAMDARQRWDAFPDDRRRAAYQEERLIVERWAGESVLPRAVLRVS